MCFLHENFSAWKYNLNIIGKVLLNQIYTQVRFLQELCL